VIVPGSGHWLMEEARGPVMEQIVSFLDAPVATGGR
jgi:pimeloyl-ACP methyl ester carboxylesterase